MKIDPQELDVVRVLAKVASADELAPVRHAVAPPRLRPGEALVRVAAAGVNPSDVKAALGLMPQAVWPRCSPDSTRAALRRARSAI